MVVCPVRWMAKDPIGFAGESSNLYSYSVDDPINLIDFDGRLFGFIDAGESAGADAAQYWADLSVDPNNEAYETVFYTGMGLLASLWTPCTSTETFLTLAGGYGGNLVSSPSRFLHKWAHWPHKRGHKFPHIQLGENFRLEVAKTTMDILRKDIRKLWRRLF